MLSTATFNLSDSVAIRVYSDSKPQTLKTADLQKGIILLYNGVEVVGEGTGFGVPIVKYSDETVFSGSSVLEVHKKDNYTVIRKDFYMDLIAREKFRNLKLESKQLRALIDFISLFFQKHKSAARQSVFATELLRKIGVKLSFIKTFPRGKVTVTYTINKNRINVNLSFNLLDRHDLQKIVILNEQGAHFFRKYLDSEGLNLADEKINIWDIVTAQSAKIVDEHYQVSFNLKRIEGTVLRRGREVVEGSLNWIGLDYELNPDFDSFEYEIEIFG